MLPLLQIQNLSIECQQANGATALLKNISIDIWHGKTTALVGESGSGKSITALSILRLLPKNMQVKGEILFTEKESFSLQSSTPSKMNAIRGKKIGMIFQEPMSALNPLFTCGKQIMDVVQQHQSLNQKEAKEYTLKLLKDVELPEPASIFLKYPHQISGGQKQRVMIAMAISCNPSLLIADEPTTALDMLVQQSIMQLLVKLQAQYRMAILLITHDLGVVAEMADEMYVLQKGNLVEKGKSVDILKQPVSDYTKSLLRNRQRLQQLKQTTDMPSNTPVLAVQQLSVSLKMKKSFFKTSPPIKHILTDINLEVLPKETVGIVGESGSGKTTLGKTLVQLIKPHSGEIFLEGKAIGIKNKKLAAIDKKKIQMVFQDPFGSLNPKLTILETLTEPMKVHGIGKTKQARIQKAIELLEQVGLEKLHLHRYPHQFSGGQRQRICIARALALEPSIIVFDESVSALDSKAQMQVLDLINSLKSSHGFAAIFISHDLSIVHYISDRILVMKEGQIAESGPADKVFFNPSHHYTKALLEAIPGKKFFAVD
jgi:peptide/nickel transport system ATP-binding protein